MSHRPTVFRSIAGAALIAASIAMSACGTAPGSASSSPDDSDTQPSGTTPFPTSPLGDIPIGTWTTFPIAPSDDPAVSASTVDPESVLYEATTMVLSAADHGPELCLSGALMSLPPQCGDVPITNWDWDMVDAEESTGGSTWASVYVQGTYDGEDFTVETVRAPTEADYAASARPVTDFRAPCPEPADGWLAHGARASTDSWIDEQAALRAYISSQPDAGGFWVDQSINTAIEADPNNPQREIVVVTFTGDLPRHEADLGAIWPGALCVAAAPYSAADLQALARAVVADRTEDGSLPLPNGTTLQVIGFSDGGDAIAGTVTIDVLVADAAAQAYFDATYGAGRVQMFAALHPVTPTG